MSRSATFAASGLDRPVPVRPPGEPLPPVPANGMLQEWLDRGMPEWLHPDAPIPPSWDGPPALWEALRQHAHAIWLEHAYWTMCGKVGDDGWRLSELARGNLDRGRELSKVSGGVVDKVVTFAYPKEAVDRAARVLTSSQAFSGSFRLDGTLETTVRAVVEGREVGRGWENQLDAAEAALNAYVLDRRAVRERQQAETMEVDILYPFTALGQTFPAGTHRLGRDLVARLGEWRESLEGQALRISGQRRPQAAGIFHGGPEWPPYILRDGRGPGPAPAPASTSVDTDDGAGSPAPRLYWETQEEPQTAPASPPNVDDLLDR